MVQLAQQVRLEPPELLALLRVLVLGARQMSIVNASSSSPAADPGSRGAPILLIPSPIPRVLVLGARPINPGYLDWVSHNG